MSDKINQELEDALRNAISGLKEEHIDLAVKEYKKYWREIKVPFSLKEGLSRYTKDELNNIRKYLKLKGISNLRKEELISFYQEKIPELLEAICMRFDNERFGLLVKIARKGGSIPAPDLEIEQIPYLRATGLVYTGIYQGEKILSLPEELVTPVLMLSDNLKIRSIVRRNTDWIKLTRGLLYYYGTLSITQLEEMLETYTKEQLDLKDYFEVIYDANRYQEEMYVDGEGFSNWRVFDPKRVKREHQIRNDISFYPFTKEQLLRAGEPDYIDRNKSYMQLVQYLTRNYEMDKEEADEIVEECVYATRIGHGPNEVLTYLSELIEFESMDSVQELTDHVVYLMNNTKEWFLKGYSSTELREKSEAELKPLLNTKRIQPKVTVTTDKKVGRNEPCPCGSGKKFKKCCGR
ncbi:preprotein translocase subunit SecA [Oceanobacillus picturae]|uniref:Preprotein translocase subunit SecA n=1 Tax=Oceanobacillus picturae TaxID=171693 RepID=A0A0U9HA59_9BACI|nr:SEC-C metal-binding domain-containing protein [Oceanobacillus picturae]GAQ19598.1 preprotein translocase subunit SecA [Oceanobacillus picturae]